MSECIFKGARLALDQVPSTTGFLRSRLGWGHRRTWRGKFPLNWRSATVLASNDFTNILKQHTQYLRAAAGAAWDDFHHWKSLSLLLVFYALTWNWIMRCAVAAFLLRLDCSRGMPCHEVAANVGKATDEIFDSVVVSSTMLTAWIQSPITVSWWLKSEESSSV